ncbi:MAG: SMC-Scp complex subunit ScpB [Deltaproteobacteria bacterium]|nr:SMC-Scp complex subunit ScpB [Deltaproteobacteria bacterium]
MNPQTLKSVVEALLFACEKPLDATDLLKIIQRVDPEVEKDDKKTNEGFQTQVNAQFEEVGKGDLLKLQIANIFSDEEGFMEEMVLDSKGKSETSISDLPASESLEGLAVLSPEDAGRELSAEEQLLQKQNEEEEKLGRADIQEAINDLMQEYEKNSERGFTLVKVAQAYQFRSKPSLAPYIRAMSKAVPTRLSQAALETLSIIAYRQPITRIEVDQIRGVDSGGVVKSLSDRELIRIVGKKDEPGRPLLYGTTEGFLEIFNLDSLQDLPSLKELHQIEEEMKRNEEPGNVVRLETEIEEEIQEVESEMELHFAELEEEEEETFSALDQEVQLLHSLDEKVKGTLNPKVEEPFVKQTGHSSLE